MKQNMYGKITLRLSVDLTVCQFKHAETLASELIESYPKSVSSWLAKPVDAKAIVLMWGMSGLTEAPTHPDCKCKRCNPEEFIAAVRAHIRDTEEFISEFRKDREGDR